MTKLLSYRLYMNNSFIPSVCLIKIIIIITNLLLHVFLNKEIIIFNDLYTDRVTFPSFYS